MTNMMTAAVMLSPSAPVVHCELCGYRWTQKEWNPSIPCPNTRCFTNAPKAVR